MRLRTRAYQHHAFPETHSTEWEEDLFCAFAGTIAMARVGRIPRWLAKSIGATTTIVNLSSRTAQKLRAKHSIGFRDLLSCANAFHSERAVREGPKKLIFLVPRIGHTKSVLKGVVKAANNGTELYLETLHPIAGFRLKKLRAKSIVVRE